MTTVRDEEKAILEEPTSAQPPRRLGLLEAGTASCGAAMAVLVGVDGSSMGRVVRVTCVGLLTALAVAAERRGGMARRGWIALPLGVVAIGVGVGFAPHLAKNGITLVSAAGALMVVAGIVLVVGGTALVTRGRGRARRILVGAGALGATVLVTFVVAPSVAATNVPRPAIGATPRSVGLSAESVVVHTSDGVGLAGWYVPSSNRAAVVLLHGAGSTRSNVLDQAAVLARHGFGVLMIDARGHGNSAGRAMDFGWFGDADIAAATRYLVSRPDVDRGRIGVVGLSMGGEEALGASGSNRFIRAVVAEGATARSAADEAWLSDDFGLRGAVQEQLERAQDWVTDVLTSTTVPTSSRAAVEVSGSTRYLLITGGDVPDEARAAAHVAEGAPDRVEVWTVTGVGHTDGLRTAPEEWEQRVLSFLTGALDVGRADGS